MPCWSGATPQQIEALFVFVTVGISACTLRKMPDLLQLLRTGVEPDSKYSIPNPSIMRTTTRCGTDLAKAGAREREAAEARTRRRLHVAADSWVCTAFTR